jgi:hypothetical protein
LRPSRDFREGGADDIVIVPEEIKFKKNKQEI